MKKLFLFLGVVTALSACKKDSETTPRVDLLTAKPWQASSVALSASGIPIPSSQFVSACQLDNTYKFNTDKTLLVDEGATKCNTTDPQTASGTWAFTNSDQSKVTITMPGSVFNGDFDIKSISSTTMQLSTTQSFNGASITIDATFNAK